MTPRHRILVISLVVATVGFVACRPAGPVNTVRVSGYVEATEVQVSAEASGRILALPVAEGDKLVAGAVIATLDPTDIDLSLTRAKAERDAADAQWRLLRAGARTEDIRQAEAQRAAAESDVAAFTRDLAAAERDLERFEALLATNAGAQKPRDDAAARRDVARERVNGSRERVKAAAETVTRLKNGARREELDAAAARVAVADAQIASYDKMRRDTTVVAPVSGTVTQKLVDQGEFVTARTPVVVMADLDHVWANLYVDEPFVPRISLGQKVDLHTDGGTAPIQGTITFISPKAEFTPKNVQTAEERSKLVIRVKVTVNNSAGVLKQGMPVEADLALK